MSIWLFAGAGNEANRAAATVTLIMMAEIRDVAPYIRLADVLTCISVVLQNRLTEMLLWN